MNNFLKIIIIFILITSCSFHKNSKFWTEEKKVIEEVITTNKRVLFEKEKTFQEELNPQIKLKLKFESVINDNIGEGNNDGRVNFSGDLKKISKYKFSKIKYFDQYQPEIIFHNNNLIFFDNKGSLIKFNENSKLIWKKNYYTKQEKKINPILFFAKNNKILIITDSISKYYAVNIETGDLIWSKYNNAPFISDIKTKGDKFFVVDSNNVLSCFSIYDGTLIWSHKSENSTIKSIKKISIALNKDRIIFNNSVGDVNALDINNGNLIWLTPTADRQSSSKPFLLKLSDLVINNGSVLFSNNNNEFYSINIQTGFNNWKQKINSELRPIVVNNLIFTVTIEGYLVVIDSKSGNIIRITDLFESFNKDSKIRFFTDKKMNPLYIFDKEIHSDKTNRPKFKPTGFIVGKDNIYLSTDHGRLFIVDVVSGNTQSILKIDNTKISRPIVLNNNLFITKNNSIIKLN